jgi:hypothetical protein
MLSEPHYLRAVIERIRELEPELLETGCTPEEVSGLSQALRTRLPGAFEEFLLAFGHGAWRLAPGSSFGFEGIVAGRESAQELLGEVRVAVWPPDDAIVFFSHGGYDLLWIIPSEGDNPAVYFREGDHGTPRKVYESFSEFLRLTVENWQVYPDPEHAPVKLTGLKRIG